MKFIRQKQQNQSMQMQHKLVSILSKDQTFTMSQMSSLQTKMRNILMLCPYLIIVIIAVADVMYYDEGKQPQ